MYKIKNFILSSKLLSTIIFAVYSIGESYSNFRSKEYWQKRYSNGGNSGAGSYGKLAEYKAGVVNDFIKRNQIKKATEFGCGDGNQISYFSIQTYIGLDVSPKSIDICRSKYSHDLSKSFYLYDPLYFFDNARLFKSELTLSLDVIFHLVEDNIYEKYMEDLFKSSSKFVLIYSSNTNNNIHQAKHMRHRKFTDWVESHAGRWKLMESKENPYSDSKGDAYSLSNFYIYRFSDTLMDSKNTHL